MYFFINENPLYQYMIFYGRYTEMCIDGVHIIHNHGDLFNVEKCKDPIFIYVMPMLYQHE